MRVKVRAYERNGKQVRGYRQLRDKFSLGFYGEGRNYSNLAPADFEAKLCPCGEKAIYRAAKRVFCRNHKDAAVYWTKKEFGRYFGRLTDELKRLGEL